MITYMDNKTTIMKAAQGSSVISDRLNADMIEENLFLGGIAVAKDVTALKQLGVTHILTLDSCPLPRQIEGLGRLKIKFIRLFDHPKENILCLLGDAIQFIQDGLSKGKVLVHCYFGVSRSATVVIAYIMNKYCLSYADAFQKVKLRRSIIYPNHGFVSQLRLYEEMGFSIDVNNMRYKKFRLGLASDKMMRVKVLPPCYSDCIKPDPIVAQIHPEPNVYRCRKCRRVLANKSNLLTHSNRDQICDKAVFIEPIQWMSAEQKLGGKLYCPKCNNKLGAFSWVTGCKCPCGAEVIPGFYMVPSKIDYVNVVKNVETTF